MRPSRNYIVANAEGLSAQIVLESFAAWTDQRLAEAMAAGKDLAFRDRPFDVIPGRSPALVGWEHVLLEPGDDPPVGRLWTVYRLQAQPQTRRTRRAGAAMRRAELARLLDQAGYVGVFDGEPAISSADLAV